jgi:hypothetical protein
LRLRDLALGTLAILIIAMASGDAEVREMAIALINRLGERGRSGFRGLLTTS